jgi:hypothetical protein
VNQDALTKQDIEEIRRKLATMSVTGVKDFYTAAYFECRLNGDRIPAARAIQRLVQAWRELRKMKR